MEIIQEFWLWLASGHLPQPGYESYILFALLVAIEGPSVTILGAVISARSTLNPAWIFVAASLGNLSADVGWYMLGYLGRFEVLTKRIGWLRKHQAKVDRLEREMTHHAVKILLMAKLSLSLMIPALIAAGMARISWRRWLPVVFIGECIWTGGLVLGGYYLGEHIKQLEQGMQILAIIGIILLMGIFIWIIKQVARTSDPDKRL